MEQVSRDDGVRRVRLGLECGLPRAHRVALVRPETREAEVELHDREIRIELRELLEPVERPLGPTCERCADLALERIVLREERRRCTDLAARIQRLALQQVTRLGIRTETHGERERRPACARLRCGVRPSGRLSRTPVGRDDGNGDDGDRSDRDRADEERDTTLRGHRRTIASVPKL